MTASPGEPGPATPPPPYSPDFAGLQLVRA